MECENKVEKLYMLRLNLYFFMKYKSCNINIRLC